MITLVRKIIFGIKISSNWIFHFYNVRLLVCFVDGALAKTRRKNSTTQQGGAGSRQFLRLNYNEAKQSKVEERSLPTLLLGGGASTSHASYLSEMKAENMWRAMGWTCDAKPDAVPQSFKYACAWRSTQ